MAVSILKEPPITTRDAFIPYLMTALNMLAPTLAARDIFLASNHAHIFLVAVLLILLGVPSSVYFRQRGYNRIVLNLVTTVPLLVLTWALVRSHPGLQFDWGNPLDSMLANDSLDQLDGMLHIFVLLAAGRAFLLVTSADLLQTPLPGISIYLLAIITHRDLDRAPITLLCLLVLFVTSAYLFTHEQHQQWFAVHTPPRIQRQLVLWTLIFSLLLFPAILLTSSRLQGFNMFSVTSRMGRRHAFNLRTPNFAGGQTVLSFSSSIDTGGSNWPRGNQLMMTVELGKNAPQNLLWRAATYPTYDRGRWESTDATREIAPPRSDGLAVPNRGWRYGNQGENEFVVIDPAGPVSDPGVVQGIREKRLDLPAINFQQKVTTVASMIGHVVPIYGAAQVTRVDAPGQLLAYANVWQDGAIGLRNVRDPGRYTYTVTSLNKPLPITYKVAQLPPLRHQAMYLQMPSGAVGAAIKLKAIEILGKNDLNLRSHPFEIVQQFERELTSQYQYTLKPSPPPPGVDPIVDFLTTQKQGYCNYFSGAMVLLCRSVGIPARFVVGFATGDLDERNADPEIVRYLVKANHAHSWVEVYLPDYGWYTVDPTAGSRTATSPLGTAWDAVLSFFETLKRWGTTWLTAFRTAPQVRAVTYGILIALAALGVALFLFFRERPPAYPPRELTPDEAEKTVLACYRRMHRWLRIWGVQKPAGHTATEFEQLFRQLNPAMGEPVRALTDLYLRLQYGGTTMRDADARRAISLLHDLWAVAKTERKRLYAPAQTDV